MLIKCYSSHTKPLGKPLIIVILLYMWCTCNPGRREENKEIKEKVNNAKKKEKNINRKESKETHKVTSDIFHSSYNCNYI